MENGFFYNRKAPEKCFAKVLITLQFPAVARKINSPAFAAALQGKEAPGLGNGIQDVIDPTTYSSRFLA